MTVIQDKKQERRRKCRQHVAKLSGQPHQTIQPDGITALIKKRLFRY
jgi:hypothetical protein